MLTFIIIGIALSIGILTALTVIGGSRLSKKNDPQKK